ncbi:MBOAT family protein [Xylariales sp. AK1849]|nr:MBOAT family protein [Xylariales sp. AK1849]
MASTGSEAAATNGDHDHVLRPRAPKPQHAQLSELVREHSKTAANGLLTATGDGPGSGMTSGRTTPISEDAPDSAKALSSARKLVRAEQRRRIFPTINYTSRVSHFDPESDYRDFHGFFNLFWIGLAIMAITTGLRNIKDTGHPLRRQIWTLFTVKLWHLAIADFMMVVTTAISLPLHKVSRRSKGGMTWKKGGMAVQSIYQVFFLLHTMVLLMKMHSYAFYNGHLSETEKRLRALDNPSSASKAPVYQYPSVENPMGNLGNDGKPHDSDSDGEGISQLREDLARELISPIGNTTYPRNLTWSNYIDYLLCPTLCYELEYPRNLTINWTSLIAKIVATFGCIFLLTIISEEYILPVLQESHARLENASSLVDIFLVVAESISWLLFPFMLTFLLVFLVIFEYVLGAFAEITRFGDRHFYADWWNSTDWMEFSREWNVPVYSFLRRHVYATSKPRIGRHMATFITFLISAFGHEIVMACITKKLRGYGFICQMLQLPIVMLQRTKWVRGRKTANNVMFWCSMILGLSLICSLYVLV